MKYIYIYIFKYKSNHIISIFVPLLTMIRELNHIMMIMIEDGDNAHDGDKDVGLLLMLVKRIN